MQVLNQEKRVVAVQDLSGDSGSSTDRGSFRRDGHGRAEEECRSTSKATRKSPHRDQRCQKASKHGSSDPNSMSSARALCALILNASSPAPQIIFPLQHLSRGKLLTACETLLYLECLWTDLWIYMKSQLGQLIRCTTHIFFFPNLLSLSQRESYCTKLYIGSFYQGWMTTLFRKAGYVYLWLIFCI